MSTIQLIGLLNVEKWCKEFKAELTRSPQAIYTINGTFDSISELQRLCSEEIRQGPTTLTSVHANSRPSAMIQPLPNSTDWSFNGMMQEQTVSSPTAKQTEFPPKHSALSASMRSRKQTQGQDVGETEDDTPMEFTSTTYQYVEKFMEQELTEIKSQCGVTVRHELQYDGYNAIIYVQAVTSDTSGAKQRLAALFSEVGNFMTETRIPVPLAMEAEVSQLNTRRLKTLILMEKDNHCTILGKQQDVDRAEEEVTRLFNLHSKANRPANRYGFTYNLPKGSTVEVIQGDITKMEVDVIVNAANERLDHAGGVARAIRKAGGRDIDQESKSLIHHYGSIREATAVHTAGGKLNCKYVVHTVPPQWDIYRRSQEDLTRSLRLACYNSLKLASDLNVSSIAIPGLGSGVFGIPKDICAQALMTAASKFFQQYSTQSTLKRIIFIDIDPITVQEMEDQYRQVFCGTGTQLRTSKQK